MSAPALVVGETLIDVVHAEGDRPTEKVGGSTKGKWLFQLVGDRVVDEHARRRRALLAGEAEGAARRALDGEIEIRPMMYIALSYDHRVVDGATSVQFLVKIKQLLEDGKIDRPVRGASLIGRGSEVLLRIDRVGKNMTMAQGMCGSSSGSVPTNVGQPMIRVTSMTVGGR